ncbi:ketosteroid isomerase-like protein [Thermosporothrix hazakensis]|jgi:ketosteroid isomerase-like protein|uniref:Ketosteroid isomerase-like protein n=1 Tax=Thermosporothrix hazakensis TaxID=644383 RepID=A0A326UH60_THEHA|nr:nuclear transport factor 2 family protein [Thermosporothrix hazakensis]PZW27075.1 ketosteroid isomerase-like protein [Thermosporothrix hazakensis]GCE50360.1 hypothetical protein KTH_52290 [Thermosporothrix hazakensis]
MPEHSNEAQIRTLVENWASAIRAQDREGMRACHTDDIVLFDVIPPLQIQGVEAYQQQWELFFDADPGGPGSFEPIDLHILAGEDVAFAHTLLRVANSTARLTLGFRKVNGTWLIAHEHHSFPWE